MSAEKFLYPVFLDVTRRRCLLIGGGPVGLRKAEELLAAGASVKAVSPEFRPGFAKLLKTGRIKMIHRRFRLSDLRGAGLVICATNCEKTNAQAGRAAMKLGALVNVVDRPPFCNFIAPAVFRNGPLAIAVSTGGNSPPLAGRVARAMEAAYGGAFGRQVKKLGSLRAKMIADRKAGKPPAESASGRAYFALLKQLTTERP